MDGRKGIIISGVFWCGLALYNERETLFFLGVATHAILYLLHTIEVKLNKLLDNQGVYVTQKELWRD
jgi:hypothetical protein